ncbi:hypothetical protein [Piscirickettsia litoralis]|uniref:Pectate lyase superfamily protein domain-containing protein n=1 Tax=Piscirickettsia litoralis TaxID=1891921 RepID=A0ABX3A5I3_9GAMM|nr:hypothetical protein [Piscirickettsia litoralis]ODN42936.1 hypothetical protein BGC07_08390 [Piscirickettsia litoralis]
MRIAVSQASAIRNIHVTGTHADGSPMNLLLCDWNTGGTYACGMTSGGFIGNSTIDGHLKLGSQQQFYITNVTTPEIDTGVWNAVVNNMDAKTKYLGTGDIEHTQNAWGYTSLPAKNDPNKATTDNTYPFTKTMDTPNNKAQYNPRLVVDNQSHWSVSYNNGQVLKPISNFEILSPDNDQDNMTKVDANALNVALSGKAGLIIMPGVYQINGGQIQVNKDQTVLGLGLPSLVCNDDGGCMKTASEGVRLAGFVFDAGVKNASDSANNVLLTIGEQGQGLADNPDILQDVYARIARTTQGDPNDPGPSAYAAVKINANYVIGQNLWLWRADHDARTTGSPDTSPTTALTNWNTDKAQYGLIVNGNYVTMDGLAVEHFENAQTLWNGKYGTINFYQSEMPYRLPEGDSKANPLVSCNSFTDKQQVCPALLVNSSANNFTGYGLGVYSYFPMQEVHADNAIEVKATQRVALNHLVDRWLNGEENSGIAHIVNGQGLMVSGPLQNSKNGSTLDQFRL